MAKKPKKIRTTKPKETFLEYRRIRMSYRQTIALFLVLGIGLFAASGTIFYRQIFTNPDRVLDDMLAKSLQTESIQRRITFSTQQSTIDQVYYNTFSPNTATQSVLKLQEGNYKAGQATEVTKESIGTQDKDFIRYTAISLPAGAAKKDFNSVLNVWGMLEKTDQGEAPGALNESIFSIVPFANLPTAEKNQIIKEADDTDLYKYTDYKLTYETGRPVITYDIALKPESLLRVLSKYASLTGNGDKEQLNPDAYKESPDINIKLKVDLLSRHVKSIEFPDSSRTEVYGAYGLQRKITTPKDTVPINELQSRLTQFQ